jgi:hypothetical protein
MAVATEWPLSGQLLLRHRADYARWVRNVFGITVFRLRSRLRIRIRSPPSHPVPPPASRWRPRLPRWRREQSMQ